MAEATLNERDIIIIGHTTYRDDGKISDRYLCGSHLKIIWSMEVIRFFNVQAKLEEKMDEEITSGFN